MAITPAMPAHGEKARRFGQHKIHDCCREQRQGTADEEHAAPAMHGHELGGQRCADHAADRHSDLDPADRQ
jgi:hypothetical protein